MRLLEKLFAQAALAALVLALIFAAPTASRAAGQDLGLPAVPREFRGLWVATVETTEGVDWPSKRNLTAAQQQAELTAIMDRAVQLHLNAIILQVRGNCDAIYDSKFEPWGETLTGAMGRPPEPYYDPLAFAVEEAHKRGLELHAWFNPYRVRLRSLKTPIARNSVIYTHPELVRAYGKYLWLDPTEPGTRDYLLSIITDVVRRYDIDGVHFDDYFFPDPEKVNGREMDFPDGASWQRYLKTGGKLSRAEWRRENVDLFVQAVGDAIKKEKPWVKFGISPFGIWQPQHPPGITGFDAYNGIYCDSRRWLAEGWVDYLAPQLYWPINQRAQSFPILLRWWAGQNIRRRILVAGMRVSGWKSTPYEAAEATAEIEVTRRQPDVSGQILWHSTPLLADHAGVADALRKGVYSEPAVIPACPWMSGETPARPLLAIRNHGRGVSIDWQEPSGWVRQWVLRVLLDGRWTTEVLPALASGETFPSRLPEMVAVSAVNRYGNMSKPAIFLWGAPDASAIR
jgi:uncharacterized lipoprotein YddW (UPF0748 family)